MLLYPEGMVKLNRSAGEILRAATAADLAAIVDALETAFQAQGLRPEVEQFLELAATQRWVAWHERAIAGRRAGQPGPPLWLLAELTYRCPLHCVFCYNPIDFARPRGASWRPRTGCACCARRARWARCNAASPAASRCCARTWSELVAEAHGLGYYTNLLTSGVGLTEARAAALRQAGLDHIQLSFQDSTRELNDFLSHTKTFELKSRVGDMLKAQGWPMVMNVVIHRLNIEHIDRIIDMADELGAEYLELANTQYYSWAVRQSRPPAADAPSSCSAPRRITNDWRAELDGAMKHLLRRARLLRGRPKKCMNGWGNVFLTIAPDGAALPCHTARMLPGHDFPTCARRACARSGTTRTASIASAAPAG